MKRKRFHWLKALFTWKKPVDHTQEALQVMKSLCELEEAGRILVSHSMDKAGIVLDHELASYFNMCYVVRTQHFAEKYGLENYLKARYTVKGFAKKHNPDEELLSLCRGARMLINFRRTSEAKESEEPLLLKEDEPLYITYMSQDLSHATHAGYERCGEIDLQDVEA